MITVARVTMPVVTVTVALDARITFVGYGSIRRSYFYLRNQSRYNWVIEIQTLHHGKALRLCLCNNVSEYFTHKKKRGGRIRQPPHIL